MPKSLLLIVAVCVCASANAAEQPPLDFNRDIRPILSENCFYCHGQDGNKREADLRLDDRDAALSKKAIVPHDAKASGLVERIFSTDADVQMPPPNSNRHLSAEEKELLRRWIAEGANYSQHWAFVAPARPAEPEVKQTDWVRTPIDKFILAKLEAANLKPSPEADRPTLIRRLYSDFIGFPPTPEEVAAFVADTDPLAYEKLVDKLLASPHYGERLALPWLDAARYADSNGFQQDGDTWQWVWRDWVVKALNDDLPFDQFTTWQLAGDLLPNATTDQKIATGFNRNHLLNGEGGAIAEEQRWVILFDRVDTTATNWLGLTMACAQCHDHKYDPITSRDYYQFLDAFNRNGEGGLPERISQRIRVAQPYLELPSDEQRRTIADIEKQLAEVKQVEASIEAAYEGWKTGLLEHAKPQEAKDLPRELADLLEIGEPKRTEEDNKRLTKALRKYFDEKIVKTLETKIPDKKKYDQLKKRLADFKADEIPRVMVMSDAKPRETKMLDRGNYLSPKEKVAFNTPAFLPPLPDGAPKNRLGLAQWLMSAEHPLTARVQVNRMWQYFFGTGLVKTAEDLGVQGEYPLHKDLLDWLAVEFRERGWSMKQMHRLIATSSVYRQSSRMSAEYRSRDPENRLVSRASRLRMPSLVLRDWALESAGLLEKKIGGKPVYPYQPDGIWEALAITKERDFTYPASTGSDLYRRSLYTFWRRTVGPANMFDAANRQTCRVRQSATNTPLHALTTLNDPTWVEAARGLAQRTMKDSSSLDERLSSAFHRVLCRAPRGDELSRLRTAYEKQLNIFQNDSAAAAELLKVGQSKRDESLDTAQHAALTAVCLGILNLDEALTRE